MGAASPDRVPTVKARGAKVELDAILPLQSILPGFSAAGWFSSGLNPDEQLAGPFFPSILSAGALHAADFWMGAFGNHGSQCDCTDDSRPRRHHTCRRRPPFEAIPVVDDYFGTKITDNYRWLEDAKSPATRAFIDAQNAYTAQYLKQTRIRPQAVEGLTALENISETSPPFERANNYFFRPPAGRRAAVLNLCATRLEGTRRATA